MAPFDIDREVRRLIGEALDFGLTRKRRAAIYSLTAERVRQMRRVFREPDAP